MGEPPAHRLPDKRRGGPAPDQGPHHPGGRGHAEWRDVFRVAAGVVRAARAAVLTRRFPARAAMLALFLAATAQAADPFAHPASGKTLQATLSRPAAQLSRAQVLQGRFTHSKHLREVPKPLVASGEFVFARDLGVYWHTRQPFDSVVVLTERGILEQNEGSPSLNLSADEQPAVRMIAR